MRTYMQGFGSLHGIFLVIKNTDANNLSTVKTAFEKIPNVWVSVFDGFVNQPLSKKSARKGRRKK